MSGSAADRVERRGPEGSALSPDQSTAGTGLTGRPITQSNLSLRAPAQVAPGQVRIREHRLRLSEACTNGHYGRVLRYVLLRDALRNLSLEPSAGCRAVNHLGLTGSDPLLQG